MQRGTLSNPKSEIQNPKFAQCWTLDPTGNWKGFQEDDTGSGIWNLIQSRTASTVNEITGITNSVGSAWATPAYNNNGNMTTIPQPAAPTSAFTGVYDAWNRLVKLLDPLSGNTVQTNAYDGRKFRTIRNDYTAGVLSETRHLFYTTGWQAIEERIGTSTTAERHFVWGLRYIDDLILRDRDTTGGGTLNERLYAMQDPNWNAVAVTNSAGVVQERYAYSPYGDPMFLSAIFGSQAGTLFDWERLFACYRIDLATSIYVVRNRLLDYVIGTWLTPDPANFADVPDHSFEYSNNDPLTVIDPSGLLGVISSPCQNDCASWAKGKQGLTVTATRGKKEVTCPVSVTCSDKCPTGGTAGLPDPKTNKISICLDSRLYLAAELEVVLAHELQHARDFCKTPKPRLKECKVCMDYEKAAHEVSCGMVFPNGTGAFTDCVACGVWTSCRASGACEGKNRKPRPEPCDWKSLGVTMPGIPFPIPPALPGI